MTSTGTFSTDAGASTVKVAESPVRTFEGGGVTMMVAPDGGFIVEMRPDGWVGTITRHLPDFSALDFVRLAVAVGNCAHRSHGVWRECTRVGTYCCASRTLLVDGHTRTLSVTETADLAAALGEFVSHIVRDATTPDA